MKPNGTVCMEPWARTVGAEGVVCGPGEGKTHEVPLETTLPSSQPKYLATDIFKKKTPKRSEDT